MNIYKKTFILGLLLAVFCCPSLKAQDVQEVADDTVLTHFETNNPQSGIGIDVTEFQSVKMCYVANQDMFVVIDSIDNAVDIIFRKDKLSFDTVLRITSDESRGRHDLANILRPKSVGFCDGYIVYLASSAKDSSYIAVCDMDGNVVNRLDFACNSYAFKFFPDELIIVGRNQQGYDIQALDMSQGIENIALGEGVSTRFHYHVPKQADRIQESDPIGIGLTAVAVSVVFLALLCISLILKGYGKLIVYTQDRRAKNAAKTDSSATATPTPSQTSGEIYAAIAAAIYLYDEEMHDEENTVITIQKVERAWTPWNAKFYNMNQYFSKNRR